MKNIKQYLTVFYKCEIRHLLEKVLQLLSANVAETIEFSHLLNLTNAMPRYNYANLS